MGNNVGGSKMNEEEYLELKEYLKQGIKRAEELAEQLPQCNELKVPSFEQNLISPIQLTNEELKIRDDKRSIMQQLLWQEIDNEFAAELISVYRPDKNTK